MSTIKVNKIENASTADGGIAIDNSGHVQIDGQQLPTAGALSNRNLIINGEQKIDQRNNGSAVTLGTTDKFITDRWASKINGGAATGQRVTDVPSGKGFVKSFKFDVTTASASPAANDEIWLQQRIEAQDLTRLRYGTSDAQSITVSFWVKSALTGDFGFFIYQSDAARAYQTTYNIATANTWEYKTITIPGDTSGTINDDTGTGFEIRWYLAVGSNKGGSSNQNAWGTDANNRHPTSTNLMASTSNDWLITGVQLEVGEKATPFEHRSYGDELARCQRYYVEISGGADAFTYSGKGQGSDSVDATIPLCVPLRASPTMNSINSRVFTDSSSFAASSSTTPTAIQFSANNPHLAINCGGFSGLTNNEVSLWCPHSNVLEISAEL